MTREFFRKGRNVRYSESSDVTIVQTAEETALIVYNYSRLLPICELQKTNPVKYSPAFRRNILTARLICTQTYFSRN